MIVQVMALMIASTPNIEQARLQTIRLEGTLERTVRSIAARHDEPVWVGYSVEAADGGDWSWCCCSERSSGWSQCDSCSLEDDHFCMNSDGGTSRDSRDSNDRSLLVLARLDDGRVETIRTFSDDCMLNGGGRALYWIEDAGIEESLDWLSSLTRGDGDRIDMALAAMSMHAGEGAIDMMIAHARDPYPTSLRRKALFWLAHRAGRKAIGALTEALDDKETGVKKAAVFGLSQLPGDEGVPLLIKVAREHRNREVRRDAIFWLGQSRDPRAFDFIVEILKG